MSVDQTAIKALLEENRTFPPSPEFVAQANVSDPSVYERAEADPEGFWAEFARELHWYKPWDTVLEWNPPHAKWFIGGKLNASYNCLERIIAQGKGDKIALLFEGEPGDSRTLTYNEMLEQTNKLANTLKSMGVQKGDRVCIYMPMIPELVISLLACARIGAPHSVVFGGFSAQSLVDRITDADAHYVITADGGYRRGKVVHLKAAVDEALKNCPNVKATLVYERIGKPDVCPVNMVEGRDHWWQTLMAQASDVCEPEPMDAEDVLYILYTSGSTGKPKGIVHTTGGYLVGAYATAKWTFDLKDSDIYWCTADIGWVTGHTYIVYGAMANGVTQVLYEGAPDWPEQDRFWEIVEKYKVTIMYTAPTAIRAFMKWGDHLPAKHDLSSLRLLGTVGEPINPEAWMWYYEHIGGSRVPIVDTWWQTETGHLLITPLPGITATKPGSACRAFPGIGVDVIDEAGNSVPNGSAGYLILTRPWPGMLRTIHNDPERYVRQYWSQYPGRYFTGDGAKKDKDGYLWLLGRVDDVMNVAGHRLSTMEIESALVDHPAVAEAAVIGKDDPLKGQAVAAFVILKQGYERSEELISELKKHVGTKIGPIARPDDIIVTAELPKTRSGKIMRRLLRDVAEGRALGDTTTLADPAVVAALKQKYSDEG
ncbi:MAG: acetyl-coenzyme A synthetase [Fimbriimonadales bacterium]